MMAARVDQRIGDHMAWLVLAGEDVTEIVGRGDTLFGLVSCS